MGLLALTQLLGITRAGQVAVAARRTPLWRQAAVPEGSLVEVAVEEVPQADRSRLDLGALAPEDSSASQPTSEDQDAKAVSTQPRWQRPGGDAP